MKTRAPSTQRGRYSSGLVRNSRTSATMAAVASCATWLWAPAPSTIAVCVGTSVDDEGPAQSGHSVGRGKTGQVGVLVQLLLMARRIDPGGRRTLGDDHDAARCGYGNQRRKISPTHGGYAKMRKTACHRSDDRNAMPAKVPDSARRHCSDNRDERARHSRRKAVKQKKGHHNNGGNG